MIFSYKYSILDLMAEDGASTVNLSDWTHCRNHQIKIKVSAEPSAGTLTVQIKSPGAAEFDTIGSITLNDARQRLMFFTGNAEYLRFVPINFDTDKKYSIYGYLS
ncbi:MAG: hypothetical protein HQK78_14460 [Desulfobacterales bacterium]|nr:hypothetical protein [Desulfobacterales bacterium]